MTKIKTLFGLVLVTFALSLTACNTAEGLGEDIEGTGDAVSDTVRDIND